MPARSRFLWITCSAALVLPALTAGAQVLPKIPPAPQPKPEYVPPPPPKPVEVKPPDPGVDVPALTVKDADGKLKVYTTSLEEAALRGVKFDPATQSKVDASTVARNRDLEKWSVDNLDKIKTALEARKELDDLKDFNQLFRAKEAANVLQQQGILDRLVTDGAITPLIRTQIDRVVTAYSDARKSAWEAETGTDVIKIATLVGRQGFADQTRDVLAAVDRLVARTAPTIQADAKSVGASPEQLGKLDGKTIDQVRSFIFEVLTPEQAKALLSRYIAPAPAEKAPPVEKKS